MEIRFIKALAQVFSRGAEVKTSRSSCLVTT
ncbi:TPA: hypothetical protein N0F65_009108 [Lagenidium giganteum]|uniref:Uncharacterized protein n=1 Tax=Lagenidium giganteum TaxID=4803 RepID=A0AAV2YR94_9STRA|nr:TPA: hypothetical protein N0F65_009108 [Lagenidium giganteum]